MRRVVPVLIACLSCLAASCGDDQGAFANISWRLRCPSPPVDGANCGMSGASHVINQFDGEEEASITCSVNENPDGTMRLGFNVQQGEDALRVQGVTFTAEGIVQRCEVRVQDGPNNYEADASKCSANAPNDTQTCQVRNVRIDQEAMPRDAVVGEILCRKIQERTNPNQLIRDLTSADSSDAPVTFSLDGCTGDVL